MENNIFYDPINVKPPGLSDKCWGKLRSRQMARRFFMTDKILENDMFFDLILKKKL